MKSIITKYALLLQAFVLPLLSVAQPSHIAYNVYLQDSINKNDYEVFLMRSDGTDRKNISNNKDVAWIYHASGSRIFLISDRDTCYRCFFLYETNKNGRKTRKVANLQLEDSWIGSTQNGDKLLVSARKSSDFRFQPFLLNSRTGSAQPWLQDTAARFSDFAFSPDGNKVVFVYKANKRNQSEHEELYLADADGTGMRQLTDYPENNISAKDHGYKAGAPRWHPSGDFISYVSQQDGHNSIFAITPDGKKQWRISNGSHDEGWHDWSADGQWLVLDRRNADTGAYEIVLINWQSKKETLLKDSHYKYNQAPVFVGY